MNSVQAKTQTRAASLSGGGQDPDGHYSPINSSMQSNVTGQSSAEAVLKGHSVETEAFIWRKKSVHYSFRL